MDVEQDEQVLLNQDEKVLLNNKIENTTLTLDGYKEMFLKNINATPIVRSSGTYNKVLIYSDKDTIGGKKISIRYSKEPIAYKRTNYPIEYLDKFEDIYNTYLNWYYANENEICPEIYEYGYYKKPSKSGRSEFIYTIMISEAYDASLLDFFNNNETNEDTNDEISTQVITLIIDLITKLNIVCYDIKPGNIVIKTDSTNNITVRMIDIDDDIYGCKRKI